MVVGRLYQSTPAETAPEAASTADLEPPLVDASVDARRLAEAASAAVRRVPSKACAFLSMVVGGNDEQAWAKRLPRCRRVNR